VLKARAEGPKRADKRSPKRASVLTSCRPEGGGVLICQDLEHLRVQAAVGGYQTV
jgi:hypothetical protein